MPDTRDTNDMTLDEAKAYMERIGIKVWLFPNTEAPIRGGSSFTKIGEYEQELVLDPFYVNREGAMWVVVIFGHSRHIIHVSQELQKAVMALENLYRLTQSKKERYNQLGLELVTMQYNGIVATIASTINVPAILATCSEQSNVDDRYKFMLKSAHLAQQSPEYRIYPNEGQWAVQSLVDEAVPPEIVPDIEQATQVLLKWCGRKARSSR